MINNSTTLPTRIYAIYHFIHIDKSINLLRNVPIRIA